MDEHLPTIEKLQISEKRFEAAVRAVEGIMWTNSPNGEMEGEQEGWAKLTGQQLKDYQGYGWSEAIHPDDAAATIEAWNYAVKNVEIFKFEHRVKTADGSWKLFSVKAIPVLNQSKEIVEWVGVHTDIQHTRDTEEKLEKMVLERTKQLAEKNLELLHLNKELQSFAHISSHDLKEPIRKIKFFLDRLKEKEFDNMTDSGKDLIERAEKSAESMKALVDDLLNYSETSLNQKKFLHTDLTALLSEIIKEIKETNNSNITITNTPLGTAEVITFQIKQLFTNLLSNALKFAKPNEPARVSISCTIVLGEKISEHLIANKNYLHISIADKGIGFHQKYGDRIFEIFQRLHTKAEYKGTGIGLAIVKKIVENHRGYITATSEINEGATFHIYLPVQQ